MHFEKVYIDTNYFHPSSSFNYSSHYYLMYKVINTLLYIYFNIFNLLYILQNVIIMYLKYNLHFFKIEYLHEEAKTIFPS